MSSNRPWFYPEAQPQPPQVQESPRERAERAVFSTYDRAMQTRTGALLIEDVPEPPLVMVPEKPCPCEVMEALLRALGEPESDNWLEHIAQEHRTFLPLLIELGFQEAANQIIAEHKLMTAQIKKYGVPDYALLKRHAAFEDALARQLGDQMIALQKAS